MPARSTAAGRFTLIRPRATTTARWCCASPSRSALTCLGLVSTRDGQGNQLTSFILIGTVEHLGLTAGFITLDGLGVLYAADRTLDVPAVRAHAASGKLKYLLRRPTR